MIAFDLVIALVLLGTIAAGLVPILFAASSADRMLAAQLIGTAGVGTLLVLAAVLALPGLVDVALVFALLAAVAVAAFTRRAAQPPGDGRENTSHG